MVLPVSSDSRKTTNSLYSKGFTVSNKVSKMKKRKKSEKREK